MSKWNIPNRRVLLLMHKVVKNRIIRVRQKSSKQIWSIVLVALSIFFIVLGGLGLLYVQQPLREGSFDTRKDASVADGPVEITTSYTPQTEANAQSQVVFKFNSHNQPVTKMELVFNVISSTFSQETDEVPTIHTDFTGATMKIVEQEMEETADGYLVSMVLVPKQGTSVATQDPTPFARLDFIPKQSGAVHLSFDPNTSHVFVSGAPTTDQLKHVAPTSHAVTVKDQVQPVKDEILFNQSSQNTTFYQADGSEISLNNLEKNKSYRVKTSFKINNELKVTGTPPGTDAAVRITLRVQGANRQTKEYPYSALTGSANGFGDTLEFDYTRTTDQLKIELLAYLSGSTSGTILHDTWAITYNLGGTGGTSDIKSCNEKCASNSECPTNHRCYKNQCRLVTNLSSSSCSQPADKGLQRTCNQYCADSRECAAGFSCYYNRCRRPDNLESTVCAMPSAALQQAIKDSCNDSCKNNGECANNMRCFNGSCRLATNPSSTSCTAATQPTVSGKYYPSGGTTKGTPGAADSSTATRSATPRPATGSAVAKPSTMSARPATPAAGLVSPLPTPTSSPQGEAIVRVSPAPTATPEPSGNIFQRLTRSGITFPLIALTIGVIILIAVGIMALLNLLKKRSGGTSGSASNPKKTQYEDELQQRINTLRQQQTQTGAITPPPSPTTPPTTGLTPPPTSLGATSPAVVPVKTEMPIAMTQPTQTAQIMSEPPAEAIEMSPPPSTLRPQSEITIEKPAPATTSAPAPEVEASNSSAATPPFRGNSMMERIRQKGINPPEKKLK